MKIAHLTSVHGAFDVRIFQKQCRTLAASGHEVHLVVPHEGDEVVDHVSIHGVKKSGGRLRRMATVVWKIYRKAVELDADVYHFHDPELIPVGLLLKRRGKVIYDSHEDYPADILSKPYIPSRVRPLVSRLFSLLETFAAKRFDAVITVHEGIGNRFSRIQPNTVLVYNYPVLHSEFIVERHRGSLDRFLWLGLFCPIRCSEEIRRAMTFAPEAGLDVIGPASGVEWNDERVRFLGSFPQKEAFAKASEYIAGLVLFRPEPNHVEALPNKLFEYMFLGLPVIASNFPKWQRIVEDAQCGVVVDPMSPEEIGRAMNWMLEHPSEAREMGRRGRQAVLERYNWESQSKSLLKLYEGLS